MLTSLPFLDEWKERDLLNASFIWILRDKIRDSSVANKEAMLKFLKLYFLFLKDVDNSKEVVNITSQARFFNIFADILEEDSFNFTNLKDLASVVLSWIGAGKYIEANFPLFSSNLDNYLIDLYDIYIDSFMPLFNKKTDSSKFKSSLSQIVLYISNIEDLQLKFSYVFTLFLIGYYLILNYLKDNIK